MANVDYTALKNLFDDHWGSPQFEAGKDAGWLAKMGAGLYNTGGLRQHVYDEMTLLPKEQWTPETLAMLKNNMAQSAAVPLSFKPGRTNTYEFTDGKTKVLNRRPIQDTLGVLGQNIKAHPWQTAGTALNAAGNVAGLVDNDKLLGQILGTAGGALLGAKAFGLGPLGIANVAMGGGNLGALFDALRSKKAQEEQYQQQYV